MSNYRCPVAILSSKRTVMHLVQGCMTLSENMFVETRMSAVEETRTPTAGSFVSNLGCQIVILTNNSTVMYWVQGCKILC